MTDALAAELTHLPETRDASLVLWISVCHGFTAELFTKNQDGKTFSALPFSARLSTVLTVEEAHNGIPDTPEGRVAELLRRMRGLLSMDCVLVETRFAPERLDACRDALPPTAKLFARFVDLNTPSLAHCGALRVSRRHLWESLTDG